MPPAKKIGWRILVLRLLLFFFAAIAVGTVCYCYIYNGGKWSIMQFALFFNSSVLAYGCHIALMANKRNKS